MAARTKKIIAVPFGGPTTNNEMRHFFSVYKALENKDTVVDEVLGPEDAVNIIQKAIDFIRKSSVRKQTDRSVFSLVSC